MSTRSFTRRCGSPTLGLRRWHVVWEADGEIHYAMVLLSRHIAEPMAAIFRAQVPDGAAFIVEPEL